MVCLRLCTIARRLPLRAASSPLTACAVPRPPQPTDEEIAALELKKKRTFRKFTYRGIELDNLLDLTPDQLVRGRPLLPDAARLWLLIIDTPLRPRSSSLCTRAPAGG